MKVAILANIPRHSMHGNTQGRGGGHGATWLPPLADAFLEYSDLDITWVTLDRKVRRTEIDREGNQRLMRIPMLSDLPAYLLSQWPTRLKLRRIIKEIAPDIVHVWGTEWLYAAVLQDLKVPSVLSVQGCLTAFSKVWKPSWRQRILAKAEPKRVKEADVVTCESLWSAEQIRLLNPQGDIRVVDYGVHPSFYDVKWDPDPAKPILLFSGSLDYRKGVDVLFDALEKLPERTWTCQILGDGPMRADLESRNLPNVEFLGTLLWDAMQQRLAKAWALVVPTRADTGPSVVKEARVVGLPVIGSVNGGLRDYIREGENGFKVDPLNAANLASVCEKVMQDYERVRYMGASGHDQDRAYFTPSRCSAKFVEIYQSLK
jgi:glycosyltransferase involved in cell wall biosynthesis